MGSRRILVVDDNREIVDSLALILREEGYVVDTAYDGRLALEIIASTAPDAVVLDIGMPGLSGYDVVREVRRRYERRPLMIAFTAWSEVSDKILAKQVGFDHYLEKPASPRDLLKLLSEHFNA
jgi:DNA-binding response OmpR family regulator